MNFGVKLALEAEGFTEAQVNQIDAAIPALLRVIDAYKKSEVDIATLVPIVEMVIKQVKG